MPAASKKRMLVDGPVQVLGAVASGYASAVHPHVQIEHNAQGLLPLARHLAQQVQVQLSADHGIGAGLVVGLGQIGEAFHFAGLHHGVGQNGVGGTGVQDHFQLFEDGAFEAGDTGLQLAGGNGRRFVGFDVDHEVLAPVCHGAQALDIVVDQVVKNQHGRGLNGVGVADFVVLVFEHGQSSLRLRCGAKNRLNSPCWQTGRDLGRRAGIGYVCRVYRPF